MDQPPEIRLELPPRPASAGDARRFVGSTLDWLGAAEVAEVAVLLTSELVTNAVRHAGGPIEVAVHPGDDWVRVAVADPNPVVPSPRHPEPDAIGGRGLAMVETLARRWGVEEHEDDGKAVWFELSL